MTLSEGIAKLIKMPTRPGQNRAEYKPSTEAKQEQKKDSKAEQRFQDHKKEHKQDHKKETRHEHKQKEHKDKEKHVKSSKHHKDEHEADLGTVTEEVEVPVSSEVVFRKIWQIRRFHHSIKKRDFMDSPVFQCSVNGVTTHWNVSIRFWKGQNGKKITNPLVVCLNLTGCKTEETGQARVRFQFGVWDASIRHWETCPISSVVLNLENKKELISVGYNSLGILDRHIDSEKDVRIMVKLQIIHSDEEVHSLSQDMARLLGETRNKDTIIETTKSEGDRDLTVHSWILKLRSAKLGTRLKDYSDPRLKNIKYKIDFADYSHGLITEFVRYMYTDKVESAETWAAKLLPLASQFNVLGLIALCERTLLESLTPSNVANILILADECGCENLRKGALHYCEDSEEIKGSVGNIGNKTLAWRVMEMVNPDLFLEACESINSSSSNLDNSSGSWSE